MLNGKFINLSFAIVRYYLIWFPRAIRSKQASAVSDISNIGGVHLYKKYQVVALALFSQLGA